MKIKIALFLCVLFIALTGCKDDVHVHQPDFFPRGGAQIISKPDPAPVQNDPGPAATQTQQTFSSDDVIKLLKAQGIPLTKVNYLAEAFPLNNVNPEIYNFVTCDGTPDCQAPHEYLYLYIFNSQEDRVKSIDDLNKQMQKYDEKTRPVVFQNKNAIVMYWHVGSVATEIETKLEKALHGWDSPWDVPAKK